MSVIVSEAAKLTADRGVNVIEIVQEAPAATDDPQVLVWTKPSASAPLMLMLVRASAALPVLERVAV